VFLDRRKHPGIDITEGHAGVRAGYAQVGCPLDVFPVGFQLELISQLIEQCVQGFLVKHNSFLNDLGLSFVTRWGFSTPGA